MDDVERIVQSISATLNEIEERQAAALLEQNENSDRTAEERRKDDNWKREMLLKLQAPKIPELPYSTAYSEVSARISHNRKPSSASSSLPLPPRVASISAKMNAMTERQANTALLLENTHILEESVDVTWKVRPIINEKVIFTPLPPINPWRTSKQPWSKKKAISQDRRKITLILNKSSPCSLHSKELVQLLLNNDDNFLYFITSAINQVLRHPRSVRMYVDVLDGACMYLLHKVGPTSQAMKICSEWTTKLIFLLARRAAFACMDILVAERLNRTIPAHIRHTYELDLRNVYPEIIWRHKPLDKFMQIALEDKTVELAKSNRQRMCDFLMIPAELQKHGILKGVEYINPSLDSLMEGSRVNKTDNYNTDFVIKWLLKLKKKMDAGFWRPLKEYSDDMDNYAPRKIPKWKKEDINNLDTFKNLFDLIAGQDVNLQNSNLFSQSVTSRSLTLILNQITPGNLHLNEQFYVLHVFLDQILLERGTQREGRFFRRVVIAGMADRGRNARTFARFLVALPKRGQSKGDEQDWNNRILTETQNYVKTEAEKLIRTPGYGSCAALKRKANDLLMGYMMFTGAFYGEFVERHDCVLAFDNDVLMNELENQFKIPCKYFIKWYRRLDNFIRT